VRDEQALDEVVFLHRGGGLAAPAAPLRPVVGERLGLDVAAVREGDHHVLRRDQVLDRDVLGDGDDLAAPLVGEGFLQRGELLADDPGDARRLGEDVEQVADHLDHLAVLVADLVLLQAGEALQAQLEDRLRLRVGQEIALGLQAEILG
jgi:hypothetical protein